MNWSHGQNFLYGVAGVAAACAVVFIAGTYAVSIHRALVRFVLYPLEVAFKWYLILAILVAGVVSTAEIGNWVSHNLVFTMFLLGILFFGIVFFQARHYWNVVRPREDQLAADAAIKRRKEEAAREWAKLSPEAQARKTWALFEARHHSQQTY